MKIIIGCERSGRVRDAFAARGHEAWSCDLYGSYTLGRHIVGNLLDFLDEGWDMGIFHPPCTHLSVSGARWFKTKGSVQEQAVAFVQALLDAPIPKIVLEQPVSIISTRIRKPDQTIQPWMFGEGECKRTCLWLKNVPPLMPTHVDDDLFCPPTPIEREQRIWKLGPSEDRGMLRSITFQKIAEAMAEQWG